MAERVLPAPEVWAAARARETGRDAARDAAVAALDPGLWERSPYLTLVAAARARPDGAFLRDRGQVLSNATMAGMATALARVLAGTAAPAGPVAVLARDGATQIAAQFACMAAGRVSVMLDPSAPAGHGRAILAAVRPAILAADGAAVAELGFAEAGGARWFDPHEVAAAGAADPAGTVRRHLLDMDAPAFIMPTSGSTGVPKLVVHSQRGLSYIAALFTLGLGPGDHYVSAGGAPGTYSSTKYMLAMLFSGASMHFANLRQEGYRTFLDRLATDRASVLRTGASFLRVIGGLEGAKAAFATLRHVRLGGEPTGAADLALIRALLPPDCLIHNTYGATECIGFHHLATAGDAGSANEAAGLPAGFVDLGGEAVVLEEDAVACPPGAVGEIAIRSRYNALGEWTDGRLVPGRLVPDPAAPGTRIYFTGDLGRRRADGALLVMGRKDRMLKLNGQRIDPGQVEAVIRELADVAELCVLPREMAGATTLVAFVVPGMRGREEIAAALRTRLRERLPVPMRPARIVMLDAMPRLANGKVDAQALLAGLD